LFVSCQPVVTVGIIITIAGPAWRPAGGKLNDSGDESLATVRVLKREREKKKRKKRKRRQGARYVLTDKTETISEMAG
jgi:hypothetical protein